MRVALCAVYCCIRWAARMSWQSARRGASGRRLPNLSGLLDRVIPDSQARAQAQLELLRFQQEGGLKELDAQLQTDLAQAWINEIEAAQSSLFKSGWRLESGVWRPCWPLRFWPGRCCSGC